MFTDNPGSRLAQEETMRSVTVGAAQMGPNNESASREEIVERMLALLEQARAQGVELLAYPEMALTTYFPKTLLQPVTDKETHR
jgi:predicted amidohydrolase